MTNFFVGQKVVCIRTINWSFGEIPKSVPVKGEVCTIKQVRVPGRHFEVALKLIEHSHGWFNAKCFRPVVHPRIEELRKLLNPTPDDIKRLNDHDTKRFVERQKERAQ